MPYRSRVEFLNNCLIRCPSIGLTFITSTFTLHYLFSCLQYVSEPLSRILLKSKPSQYKYLHINSSNVNVRGVQIFQNSRSTLKIIGAVRVIQSNFRIEGPQILGAIAQNLIATVIWPSAFVHPLFVCLLNYLL